jgi:glucokinase
MKGGIDLGGTKIQAVVVDEAGAVLGETRRATPVKGGPADVAREMATALEDAAGSAGVKPHALGGVGVGSPGAVDNSAGTVSHAQNLPGWEGTFALAAALSQELGTQVVVDNDVSVAVKAEFLLGAGKPFNSILGVFWGTGVGGGLILDGRQWFGRGAAGEIGHMVVKSDGARCPCGRRGCLEAYAGRGAMEARARQLVKKGAKTNLFNIMEERKRPRLTSGVWARALASDDRVATEMIDRAVEALGTGIASAINLIDVEAVVIGGGLGDKLGEPYAARIKEAMMPHLFVSDRPPVVCNAALGDLGGAIGASLLIEQ